MFFNTRLNRRGAVFWPTTAYCTNFDLKLVVFDSYEYDVT